MIRYILPLLALFVFAACSSETGDENQDETLTKYVDPFIGTAEHGHVYPGASVPFGAVQLSPDNGTQGWDWCSGYNYADSIIVGFSHTHLSGTGIGDLCDILVMPAIAQIDLSRKVDDPRQNDFASTFSHDNENASPGYYAVKLDNGIQVELTASERVGFHRYAFPQTGVASLVLDLSYAVNWDRPTETLIKVENDTLITGQRFSTGWAKDQRVFFAMALSRPVNRFALADSTAVTDRSSVAGRQARGQFFFDGRDTLKVKVGISSANAQGARDALREIPHWNFAGAARRARDSWETELAKIEVVSDDEDLKKVFYTALYRTCLAPVLFSDANGFYKGPDGRIHQARDYVRYDIFSLWDTFRAAHPLYTITQPDRVNDMVRSMLAHYDEYGLLPVWSLLGNETNTMTGYHAIPVIVDAYLKGFRGFDAEKAFAAMKKSAMQDIRGTDFYRKYGYIPYDKHGESVTKTLEYAYDDWCIAQMAKALGKRDDFEIFMKRAESYRAMFDSSTGFMRAKLSDGSWKKPFDPQFSDHNFDVAEYTEGNAWQHSWFVPHDPAGLIALHGGAQPFMTKLDSLFTVDSEIRGENASVDISGLIGQYAHGNEPSHHIAYLYNYAGAPWKTQEMIRKIMATQYDSTPAGLCGNEDCGQMSAWYVFSAMGLYPVNPAEGIYVIGSPLFEQATLNLGSGKTFTIRADNASSENLYVQSASLNGQPLERSYITHVELSGGGELVLEMGDQPNKELWSNVSAFPPSMTDIEKD
jgi:predicted alpha-1,2-mannosidase